MKKSEFKSIVKECLMEILSEGIGNLNNFQNKSVNENKTLKQNTTINKQQNLQKNDIKSRLAEEERKKELLLKQKKALMTKLNSSNEIIQKKLIPQTNQQKQNKSINPALSKLREDHKNVMMSIFEDTAKNLGDIDESNTYVPPAGASKEQILVGNSTPEELFGADTANKWAALAFMDPENKK